MFDDLRERAVAEYEEQESEEPGSPLRLEGLLSGVTSQQRFVLSLMLLFNVIVIGCMCLAVFGRIQF